MKNSKLQLIVFKHIDHRYVEAARYDLDLDRNAGDVPLPSYMLTGLALRHPEIFSGVSIHRIDAAPEGIKIYISEGEFEP